MFSPDQLKELFQRGLVKEVPRKKEPHPEIAAVGSGVRARTYATVKLASGSRDDLEYDEEYRSPRDGKLESRAFNGKTDRDLRRENRQGRRI